MSQAFGIVLTGLAFGMLLFLLASGLTLIFGLLGYVNLAHGSVYLLTAYLAIETYEATSSYPLAAAVAIGVAAALGVVVYVAFLRGRPRLRTSPLAQVLLSFGVIYVIADLTQTRYDGLAKSLAVPRFLSGNVNVAGAGLTGYRTMLIGAGIAVAIGLWLLLSKTSFGASVRAGVDDAAMLASIGINPERLFAAVIVLGFALAGLAGLLGSAFIGTYPGVEYFIILYTLPIVVVGGLGSLSGAFLASLLVGVGDALGKAYFPEVSLFVIFAIVVAALAVRPQGLLRRA
jgi:branched-chain amino acid transport system permease protein